MDITILLLDCSKDLEERLKRQGFDIATGSVGVQDGKILLPGPIYEYDVVIYNPPSRIQIQPPSEEYDAQKSISQIPLEGHIRRGANILIFINHIFDELTRLNTAYEWVPNMLRIETTQDSKPFTLLPMVKPHVLNPKHKAYANAIVEVAPLLSIEELKLPVRHKFVVTSTYSQVPLFLNRQGDYLGFSLKLGTGRIIALPEFVDNESVINDFLNRVLPSFYPQSGRADMVDAFSSPSEADANEEIKQVASERKSLDERFELAKMKLASATREKRKTIETDDTARLITSYYRQANQDEDNALFHLYKIIDALQKKFGGETAAKKKLGKSNEWKLIGKMANASYGDIRHAPKPGDKIKEWTKDEIAACFSAARSVLTAYFRALF